MSYDCWTNNYTVIPEATMIQLLPNEFSMFQKSLLVLQIEINKAARYYSDTDEYFCQFEEEEEEQKKIEKFVGVIDAVIAAFKETYDLSLDLQWLEEPDSNCDLDMGSYWVIEDALILNPKFVALTKKFGNIPVQLTHTVCG